MRKLCLILLLFTSIYCHKNSYRIPKCPLGEEFHQCRKMEPNCDTNRPPISCPYICRPGCSCIPGYARYGRRCIPHDRCPSANLSPIQAAVHVKCPLHQIYRECGRDQYCGNQLRVEECSPGCKCKDGYVRSGDECVLPTDCNLLVFNFFPIAQIIRDNHRHPNFHPYGTVRYKANTKTGVPFRNPKKYSTITTTSLPSPSPTSLEHVCPSNQRFYSCIGCQHTCDNKKIPSTCILECIRGCGCKEGYVRNPDNECILPNECPIVYPVQSIEEESIASLIEDTSLDPANSKSLPIENEAGSLSPDDSTSAKSFIETELDESQETSLEEYSSQYTTSTWTFNYNDFLKSQEEELGFTEVVESQYVAVPVQDGCGRNEEPSVCVGCERTCKMGSHTHSCPSICSLGCACKDGFARDELNQCIPSSECPPPEKEYVDENALPFTTLDMDSIITIAPFIECPVNQIYKQCVDCDPLCEEGGVPRDKTCLDHCRPGCGCLPGMVKSRDQCMLLSECPFTDLKQPELRIAEIDEENGKNGTDICPVNQKMKTCIECEGTCDFPAGSTDCIGSCSSGCGCKQGFLKDGNGNCIPPSQCPLLKKRAGAEPPCPSNQIYRECKVCDEYCDGMIRPCPKMCVPGCNCAPGMVRDGVHCVKRDTCPV